MNKGPYANNGWGEASEINQIPTFCTDQKSNPKHIPGESEEVGTIIKGLKDISVMVSSHLHLIYLGGPWKNQINIGTCWWTATSKWSSQA